MGERNMSKVLIITLCALLALALAEDVKKDSVEGINDVPDDGEDDPAQQGKEELDKMDKNKDGKADLEELQAYMKAEFYAPEDIKEEGLTDDQVKEKSAADAKEDEADMDEELDEATDEGDEGEEAEEDEGE